MSVHASFSNVTVVITDFEQRTHFQTKSKLTKKKKNEQTLRKIYRIQYHDDITLVRDCAIIFSFDNEFVLKGKKGEKTNERLRALIKIFGQLYLCPAGAEKLTQTTDDNVRNVISRT